MLYYTNEFWKKIKDKIIRESGMKWIDEKDRQRQSKNRKVQNVDGI